MYDIIIIGGGPAGLTSAIYGAMANKKVLVLEKMGAGGKVANINKIKNYPGFKEIDGFELSINMKEQAKQLGAEFKTEEVIDVELEDEVKLVRTYKQEYNSKSVVIATGAYAKPLDVDNEKDFYGRGLSYCATCDGNFFKDKTVAVVGGGASALDDCIYLSNLAKKVYLIHRRDSFNMLTGSYSTVQEIAKETLKIEILTNTVVTKLNGKEILESIDIENKISEKKSTLKVDGIFVAIGRKPDTAIFENLLKLDDNGFIITNELMQTNLKGVYAVGDVRDTPLRQIVTACSDGAIAVSDIVKNIN